MKKQIARILFAASIVSYIVSLFVPAFYDARSTQAWFGLGALISGVFGLFGGYYYWLANPLIVTVWIAAFRKRRVLVVFGALLGSALCLSFLSCHAVEDEVGETPVVGIGPGFWLWFLSPLLMFFYGLLFLKKNTATEISSSAQEPIAQ